MRSFGSDNHSGAHPLVLEAMNSANYGHDFAYGVDAVTKRVDAKFREMFGPQTDVYFVFNGTGANILSIKTLTRSFNGVICAHTAHINVDECGAPEVQTGCKLMPVHTPDGKLTPDMVRTQLHSFGFMHHSQPKVVSISQPTELGTLYSVDEIKALADLAHEHGMYLHVDGARFANAVAALGISPKEMIADTGVDAMSFGGTKNGMVLGEAVVFMNREVSKQVIYERKQVTQLCSKMRFISAQFEAYLHDDLWIKLAKNSNAMAQRLYKALSEIPQVTVTQKVQANGVFLTLPADVIEHLREEYFFYDWDYEKNEIRFMCSFDTTEQDVDRLIDVLKKQL